MNHDVDPDSNFKRIQRLIDEVTLSAIDKHHFVMMGRKKVRIAFLDHKMHLLDPKDAPTGGIASGMVARPY